MGVTTLFSDGSSWVASTRLVYTAAERGALESVTEHAARSNELVESREAALAAARDEARDEGFEAGRHEARERAGAELGESLAEFHAGALAERRRQREAVVVLALDVVRRVVGEFAPEERLVALAQVAVAELMEEPRLTLHVAPERCEAVRAHLLADGPEASDTDASARRRRRLPFDDIVGDEALAADGALIETAGGRIAIDLETQLEAVRERLVGAPELALLLGEEMRS